MPSNTTLGEKTRLKDGIDEKMSSGAKDRLQSAQVTSDMNQEMGENGVVQRWRCSMPLFTANISCQILLWVTSAAYTAGVIRTLERRFGLSSSQSGFILAGSDMMHTCVVLFIGFFGRHGNKPRIICITSMISGIGNFLMALPYWLYDYHAASVSTSRNNSSHQEFCSGSESWSSNETSPGTDCDDEMLQTAVYRSAFHLFILARLLHGFGYSGIQVLGMTYIEENSQKTKSTLYIGVMTSTLAFGSLCGFLLASFMLRMPENLSSEVLAALRPDDAKWIGCWWLGYLLISICFLFASIPLWFFPSSMAPRKPILSRKTNTCRQSSIAVRIWKQITEFLSYVSHIFRNSSYVINAGFKVCESFVTFGLIIAASRYIEIAFYQHAYMASIISALSCSLPTALGGFAGGLIMSRLRTKPPGMVRLMIISTTISMIGVGFVLFLRCPRLNIAGRIHSDSNRFTVGTECSNQCACSVDRKSSYNPVCGSDNFTYFSACIAGCTDVVNGTFVGCQCIGAAVDNSSTKLMRSMDDWTARPGLCLPKCWIVALFGIVIFPSVFMFAVARAPTTVINFRVVDGDKRSFALAFNSFISQLVGAIPGPMLFGALIDSTCLLWQTDSASQSACKDSSSSTGSCLLFDTDLFRWRTYGVTFGVQLLQVLLAVLLYCVIRRRHFDDMDVICQKTVDVPAAPATQKQSCDSALTDEYLELCQKH